MPNLSFSITDEDYADFECAFLKENPIPPDSIFTSIEWMEVWGRKQYLKAVERGKVKLAQESVTVSSDIITCSRTS